MCRYIVGVLIISAGVLWPTRHATAQVIEQDSLALVSLFNSTDGNDWGRRTNWLADEPVYNWHGISSFCLQHSNDPVTGHTFCNKVSVSRITLNGNGLNGIIPPDLANLKNLDRLYLNNNQLTGTIPVELGNLTNLEYLKLHSNFLSGTIPVELANLSNLNHLWLQSNRLSGTIPSELGNLNVLMSLYFYKNQLTGIIPPELGNLAHLIRMDLSSNSLSGTIPPELGNLSKLKHLSLYSNSLSGTIPSELGDLSLLVTLYLHKNQLTGVIPSELGNLTQLFSLYLSDNELSGSIPAELGNLNRLIGLFLSNNKLSGPIPVELNNMDRLHYLYLSNNELSGEISNVLIGLSQLIDVRIDRNRFEDLPDLRGTSVFNLDVSHNRLTFEDIEPNISIPQFRYWPQDSVGVRIDTTAVLDQPFEISVSVGGRANRYRWLHNNKIIPGASDSTYRIPAVALEDSGSYVCLITNTIATRLTLYSRPINVSTDTSMTVPPPSLIPSISVSSASVDFDSVAVSNSVSKKIVISNPGNAALEISSAAIIGTNASDFNTSPVDLRINPGGQDTLLVTFAPNAIGDKSATLQIMHNANGNPTDIPLIGVGTELLASQITVNTTTVTFDSTAVSDSTVFIIILSNTGSEDLGVVSINLSGPDAEDFTIIDSDIGDIEAGSQDTIRVLFTPDSTGSKTAQLELIHDGITDPIEIQLIGEGVEESVGTEEASPAIAVNPVSVVFDSTAVADSTSQTIVVSNSGTADLVIGTITVTGTDTGLFDVDPSSMTITPGSQDTLLVTFHPDSAGSKAATLQLNHNASVNPLEIPLSGIGIDTGSVVATRPAISVSPTSVTFDSVAVSDSTVQVIVVSNPGTADLVISNIAVTGLDMGMFKVPTSSMSSVAPGGQDSIRIVFYPDSPGPKSATLQISHNAATSPFSIPLVGTGIEVPDGVDENERFVYSLGQNYPNPFNPQTKIRYGLPEAMHMRLTVYSITGQEVRILIDGQQSAGMHEIEWDGRDNAGRPLSSGVYLYRMETAHFVKCLRMVRLK